MTCDAPARKMLLRKLFRKRIRPDMNQKNSLRYHEDPEVLNVWVIQSERMACLMECKPKTNAQVVWVFKKTG
jgi:hypothetical protein